MPNLSQFNDQTKYNSRTADANAQQQNAQRAAQVTANQAMPLAPDGSGQLAAPVAKVATNQPLQNAQTVYGAKGAGTTAQNGVVTQTLAPSTGAIQDSERARLKASGMNDSQIAEREAQLQPQIQRTMSNTGLQSTDRQNQTVTPLQSKLDAIDQKYKSISESGNMVDAAAVQAEKQTAIAQDTATNTKAAEDKKAAQDKQANDTANSTGETTPPPVPDAKATGAAAAIESGLAKVDPALAAAWHEQQLAQQLNEAQNKTSGQQQQDLLDQANQSINERLDSWAQGMKEGQDAIKQFIEDQAVETQEDLQKQKDAALAQATWDENQNERRIEVQKTKEHEAMVAQIALGGGFAQDAGLAAVRESDASFESQITDLRAALGVQKTDIGAKYSALFLANKKDYRDKSIQNIKDGMSNLEKLTMQGNTQTQAYATASANIMEKTATNEINLRAQSAKNTLDMTFQMREVIKQEKQEKIDKEDRALSQITKLLNDFPENEVRGLVMELGKDVTSFSVEKMLNAKSKDEIKAAQQAAAAKQNAINMALIQKQRNAPVITKDEFINKKIAEKEQALGMTMTEKMRQEYLKTNQPYFDTQFDQYTAPNFQNITSGNPNIDAATDAFIRGDFTTVKEAAKTYNVSPSDVATYAGILRSDGAKVGDIRALQTEQAKELTTLRKAIDDNDVTKKLNVMDTAIPKIGVARSSLTGVGDVALLNFYQNGIVDPGLAVRAEDATLLRKASAIKDKITTQFAEEVLLKGAFFPDETRAEMERIANQVYEATQRVYKDKVYMPIVEQGQMSGIGEPYFKYKQHVPASGNATTGSADTYISTYGY